MTRCLQMFAIATFHVNRPRFDGGVDKRVFVYLEMNASVKPMLGQLIDEFENQVGMEIVQNKFFTGGWDPFPL